MLGLAEKYVNKKISLRILTSFSSTARVAGEADVDVGDFLVGGDDDVGLGGDVPVQFPGLDEALSLGSHQTESVLRADLAGGGGHEDVGHGISVLGQHDVLGHLDGGLLQQLVHVSDHLWSKCQM